MAKTATLMEEKKISKEDKGSLLVDFEELVSGKEGKRLGKTVIRYVRPHQHKDTCCLFA